MTPPGGRSRYGGYVPPPPSSNVVPQFPGGPPPIPPAVVEAFAGKFGHYVHNIYGLTETSSPTHAMNALVRSSPPQAFQ